MRFLVEKQSSTPVHVQIKERIKIALAVGELRPGDTLPSIRDLGQQIGVGRAVVWRAYRELRKCGILEINHGRRVTVIGSLSLQSDQAFTRRLESLIENTLKQARRLNVSNSSFAKLLLMRALEQDRKRLSYVFVDPSKTLAEQIAAQISRLWEMPIYPAGLKELPGVLRAENHHIHKVITNYYRYDEVAQLIKAVGGREHAEVVPISVHFTKDMIAQIEALPARSRVLLVAEDNDFNLQRESFADTYKRVFLGKPIDFTVKPVSDIGDFASLVKSRQCALVIVSNSIWDRLPHTTRRLKGITHPRVEVDLNSLESARLSAGIIV